MPKKESATFLQEMTSNSIGNLFCPITHCTFYGSILYTVLECKAQVELVKKEKGESKDMRTQVQNKMLAWNETH